MAHDHVDGGGRRHRDGRRQDARGRGSNRGPARRLLSVPAAVVGTTLPRIRQRVALLRRDRVAAMQRDWSDLAATGVDITTGIQPVMAAANGVIIGYIVDPTFRGGILIR